jgi:hypothetical protein
MLAINLFKTIKLDSIALLLRTVRTKIFKINSMLKILKTDDLSSILKSYTYFLNRFFPTLFLST